MAFLKAFFLVAALMLSVHSAFGRPTTTPTPTVTRPAVPVTLINEARNMILTSLTAAQDLVTYVVSP